MTDPAPSQPPSALPVDIESAVDTARRAVRAGGRAALAHFETGVRVERKADQSPVTAGDRASEAAILEVLRADWPDMAVLTEESGALGNDASTGRWIVDPLDGTRGFTRGGAYWGPLVALELDGEVVAGAMNMPVFDRTYWAGRGLGAYRDGERLRVSTVDRLDDAIISLGELPYVLGGPPGEAIIELVRGAYSARCYGDVGGFAMLLDGKADIWLEGGVAVWDVAPAKILIEEAGGRFTNHAGEATIETGDAVGTNGELHDLVLQALGGGS